MKVSRSMAPSSGLSQQSLRKVCPLGLESSVQQNSHIGLIRDGMAYSQLAMPVLPPILDLLNILKFWSNGNFRIVAQE
jgi:hypothetical protein